MSDIMLDPRLDGYVEAWSSQDVERLASFYTDDGVYEDAALGLSHRGQEELKAFFAQSFQAFPDFNIELVSSFICGDRAASEWIMSGTHQGDLAGLPPTGKRISVRGASLMEFEGERIRRNVDYWDQVTLLRQLGVMPPA